MKKSFSSVSRSWQHANPLGLPRSGTPPSLSRTQRGLPQKRKIRHVSKIVAISSAKGGVGKSTIAVNLALSFSRHGLRTGILDTDIFGPSIPTLLNLHQAQPPQLNDLDLLLPLENYGLKSMSMGYLLPAESAPVAWRGLMVMKALQQLLHQVDWSPDLEVLVLDLPPGTGDVQLSIGQELQVDGAVIVSTPQDIALKDAVKGIHMFEKMNIPVLGMVENMSMFICPKCGEKTQIFSHTDHSQGSGGLQSKCKELEVSYLGEVPLDAKICQDADAGKPTIVSEEMTGEKVRTVYFEAVASQIARQLELGWK